MCVVEQTYLAEQKLGVSVSFSCVLVTSKTIVSVNSKSQIILKKNKNIQSIANNNNIYKVDEKGFLQLIEKCMKIAFSRKKQYKLLIARVGGASFHCYLAFLKCILAVIT